ncbi:MAG: DNA repair exonuclease [Bacteroidetes bacterium]|nr:DNA repair exonuclease [Bacteroidota bacterium]
MKILATADLHLGKQSSNMPAELGESSVTCTWERTVEYAIDEQVDALLLTGDIVDRDNRFFEAIGPVQRAFERLGDAGIPVVMVAGNHDYDVLPDIMQNRSYDHIHLLGERGEWEARIIDTRSGKLQAVGWSFPKQHVMEDPLLRLSIQDLGLDSNLPTVGLLHGDLYDQKSHYAPVNLNHFPAGLPHAWVIGHIHKPEIIRQHDPLVFYPGSPQALSAKEPGVHGPFVLTLEAGNASAVQAGLSPVRYQSLVVDITGMEGESDFRNRLTQQVAEDTENRADELENVSRLIYDIELTGSHSSLSAMETWAQFADQFEQEIISETVVTIRKVENRARPSIENLEELAHQPTPPGIVAKAILDLEAGRTSPFLETLVAKMKEKIGSANRSGTYQPLKRFEEQMDETDVSARELLLRESRQFLGELISQKEGSNLR